MINFACFIKSAIDKLLKISYNYPITKTHLSDLLKCYLLLTKIHYN